MVRSFFDPEAIKQFPDMFKQMMPKQGLSSTPAFDVKQVMETQRKNVQAVSEAMQLSMTCFQNAMSRQAELLSKMVQDNSNFAASIMAEGTPEQKIQRQADMMRKSYEATVESVREVSDIISKSSEEVSELLNKRVSASLNEFGVAFEHDAEDAVSKTAKAAKKTLKEAA